MVKKTSISFTDWIFDQYLKSDTIKNRSKYIEEMFVKGINSELGEIQGIQAKAIDALKQVRAKDEQINQLQKELDLVKSKVMTQQKRREEKEKIQRELALRKMHTKISMAELKEDLFK